MKIVFCNQYGGQTGTSANLACIASYFGLHRDDSVVMMQTLYDKNHLDEAFFQGNRQSVEFGDCGIDTLTRMIKSERINKEMIYSCLMELIPKHLYLLPGTLWSNVDLYQNVITPALNYCMNAINQQFMLTIIDLGTITSNESNRILEQADVIVMNLSQNQKVIQESISIFNASHVFYLIGNYDLYSKYNIQYIHRTYHIPMNQIGIIPYNSMFRDAYSDGEVIKYLCQIEGATKEEINHEFSKQVKCTAEKLYEYAIKCIQPKRNERVRRKKE